MMAVCAVILFFSCNNDIENVIKVSEFEKLPELSGDNIVFRQTEYGKVILQITTPSLIKIKKTEEDESDKMEFPQGFTVVQYSDYPDTMSTITANYAINYIDNDIWEAKGNVIAENVKDKERLNTESLIWDMKKGEIYSNHKVQVSTEDDIIYGEGFRSDEQFNDWKVEKVTGVITFEDEQDDIGVSDTTNYEE